MSFKSFYGRAGCGRDPGAKTGPVNVGVQPTTERSAERGRPVVIIALGILFSGALLDAVGSGPLPWIILAAVGAGCAGAVRLLARNGRLATAEQPEPVTA
jgi:hypothetical protein